MATKRQPSNTQGSDAEVRFEQGQKHNEASKLSEALTSYDMALALRPFRQTLL